MDPHDSDVDGSMVSYRQLTTVCDRFGFLVVHTACHWLMAFVVRTSFTNNELNLTNFHLHKVDTFDS